MECHYVIYAPIGAKRVNAEGYVLVRLASGESGTSRRWIFEHRKVMGDSIGRRLLPHETVHHKNGVRSDNRLDNLELWKGKHGKGIRAADYHCPGCRCGEKA